jgi:hypothetical protein
MTMLWISAIKLYVNSSNEIFIVGSIFGERAFWVKSQAQADSHINYEYPNQQS